MRRLLVGLLLATFAITGCGGTPPHADKPKAPSTVRYLCLEYKGDKPAFGTAKRANDGTWSIQIDTPPDVPPNAPTKVGKDLVGNLRANGCHVFEKGDPTTGLSPGCPPKGTRQPVTMPDLVGMDFAKGQALVQVRKCAAGDSVDVQARSRRACKEQPGSLVGQLPRPGTILGPKTPIWVYVEAGPPCKK